MYDCLLQFAPHSPSTPVTSSGQGNTYPSIKYVSGACTRSADLQHAVQALCIHIIRTFQTQVHTYLRFLTVLLETNKGTTKTDSKIEKSPNIVWTYAHTLSNIEHICTVHICTPYLAQRDQSLEIHSHNQQGSCVYTNRMQRYCSHQVTVQLKTMYVRTCTAWWSIAQ